MSVLHAAGTPAAQPVWEIRSGVSVPQQNRATIATNVRSFSITLASLVLAATVSFAQDKTLDKSEATDNRAQLVAAGQITKLDVKKKTMTLRSTIEPLGVPSTDTGDTGNSGSRSGGGRAGGGGGGGGGVRGGGGGRGGRRGGGGGV